MTATHFCEVWIISNDKGHNGEQTPELNASPQSHPQLQFLSINLPKVFQKPSAPLTFENNCHPCVI